MRGIKIPGIFLASIMAACAHAPESLPTPAANATPRAVQVTVPPSSPNASGSPSPAPFRFGAKVSPIDVLTAQRMAWSWRPGCPVGLEDLRLLSMSFWGFDGKPHTGEMVAASSVARDVVSVFRTLFEAKFPIRRMELVDAFEGDDARSMAADNTSAFNCRSVTGNPGVWSEHSYGTAIDLNPLENPYIAGDHVEPAAAAPFVDRSLHLPGIILGGDVVDRAFATIGWGWGGRWSSPTDYQHFSLSGR